MATSLLEMTISKPRIEALFAKHMLLFFFKKKNINICQKRAAFNTVYLLCFIVAV